MTEEEQEDLKTIYDDIAEKDITDAFLENHSLDLDFIFKQCAEEAKSKINATKEEIEKYLLNLWQDHTDTRLEQIQIFWKG